VELTCHISCDNYTYDRTLTVTAAKAVTVAGEPLTGIAAYYDFEDSPARNLYNNTQSATFTRQGTATPIAKLLADPTRYGKVAQINAGDVKKNSFVRFPNPLKDQTGLTGFSVAVRLYREDDADLRGTLWSFTDNIPTNTSVKQRFFINGNATMHFQDDAAGTNSFDINALNDAGTNATKYIPAGKWVLLTVTVDAANGVSLYVDGVKKAHKYFTSTAGTAGTAAATAAASTAVTDVIGRTTSTAGATAATARHAEVFIQSTTTFYITFASTAAFAMSAGTATLSTDCETIGLLY
jgi:hypothetical protein